MKKNSTRLYAGKPAGLISAFLLGIGVLLPSGQAMAAPGNPKLTADVHGIHVRRTGDSPEARETAKMMLNALKTQCGSSLMKQTCRTMLSDPAASPESKSRCMEMMSSFKLNGNPNDIGQTVIDEYFAPALGRSVRIIKTMVPKQTGMCESSIEQNERREITHHRTNGFTRHERKMDKAGRSYWFAHEHRYVPGLADMLKSSVDMAQLSGKVTVSASLGHKTLVPGRACEIRRVASGAVEFVSCIHATGFKFPSHVRFESEMLSGGKTSQIEKLVFYKHDLALSRDLFFPKPDERVLTEESRGSNPNNPTSKWCAAEKARTGVDPCEDDDE